MTNVKDGVFRINVTHDADKVIRKMQNNTMPPNVKKRVFKTYNELMKNSNNKYKNVQY